MRATSRGSRRRGAGGADGADVRARRTLLEAGEALQDQDKWDDALAILRLNLEASPESESAQRAYAIALVSQGLALGPDSAAARVLAVDRQFGTGLLDENALTRLGYRALNKNEAAAAVALFRLNVERHPGSWNVYDSLGEGLIAAGDTTGAMAAYQKSLELNPQNANAANVLKKLGTRKK